MVEYDGPCLNIHLRRHPVTSLSTIYDGFRRSVGNPHPRPEMMWDKVPGVFVLGLTVDESYAITSIITVNSFPKIKKDNIFDILFYYFLLINLFLLGVGKGCVGFVTNVP